MLLPRSFWQLGSCLLLVAPLSGQIRERELPLPSVELVEPSWAEWWRLNQASFLEREEGSERGSRTGAARAAAWEKVVPELLAELEGPVDPLLERQLLMALARIGDPARGLEVSASRQAIEQRLVHPDAACRRAAVLALGVLGYPGSAEGLIFILEDDARACLLFDRPDPISLETRAFAAYSLGLLGAQAEDPALRRRIVAALWRISEAKQFFATPELKTAAVIAMGLVPLEHVESTELSPEEEPAPPRTLSEEIRYLLAFATAEEPSWRRASVRAHASRAVTRLYRAAPELKEEIARALLPYVTKRGSLGYREVRVGASIALGFLGDLDGDPLDVEIRAALGEATANADERVKVESLCALGRIGARPGQGEHPIEGADELQQRLGRHAARGRSRGKPYALLALTALETTLAARGRLTPDEILGFHRRFLERSISSSATPAAAAIALGLLGDRESAPLFAECLPESLADPLNGYLALGLAWMGEESAVSLVGRILDAREADGECLEQAALAAARTGDLNLAAKMLERLCLAGSRETCAALARGLSRFDDRRLQDPLIEILHDDELPALVRAHAAAILGRLGASRTRPWEEELMVGLNYSSTQPTLTGPDGCGVLDFP